jgi:hypothetical protein
MSKPGSFRARDVHGHHANEAGTRPSRERERGGRPMARRRGREGTLRRRRQSARRFRSPRGSPQGDRSSSFERSVVLRNVLTLFGVFREGVVLRDADTAEIAVYRDARDVRVVLRTRLEARLRLSRRAGRSPTDRRRHPNGDPPAFPSRRRDLRGAARPRRKGCGFDRPRLNSVTSWPRSSAASTTCRPRNTVPPRTSSCRSSGR